jgi:hypothetical protein
MHRIRLEQIVGGENLADKAYVDNKVATALDDSLVSYDHQFTALEIANSSMQLQSLPDGVVNISLYNGIQQKTNVDFTVTGDTVSWLALGMALLIDVDDYAYISYRGVTP